MNFTSHMAALLIKQHYKDLIDIERNYCYDVLYTSPIDAYKCLDSKSSCIIPKDIMHNIISTINSDSKTWKRFLNNGTMQRWMGSNICIAINFMTEEELLNWITNKMNSDFKKNINSYEKFIDSDKFDIIQSYLVMKKINS